MTAYLTDWEIAMLEMSVRSVMGNCDLLRKLEGANYVELGAESDATSFHVLVSTATLSGEPLETFVAEAHDSEGNEDDVAHNIRKLIEQRYNTGDHTPLGVFRAR